MSAIFGSSRHDNLATAVDEGLIVEQTLNTYDEVGNLASSANFQRLNDVPSTATGALGYTSAAYPSSIAAYPMLEGSGATTADASGHGHTGALTGGVTWGASGPTGHCLTFNGSTGDVSFPISSMLNPASFTTAAWANWGGGGGDYQNVAASILINTGGWYILRDIDGVWHAFLYGGSSYADLPGPTAVSGDWIHLALTYDQTSGTATFYVNGVAVGSQSFPAFVPNTTVPWHIGAGWDGTEANYFLDGSVADVRLYDRALSANEIAGLYDLSPAARVSYTAAWYDGVDRNVASANYGAIDSFIRPNTGCVTH